VKAEMAVLCPQHYNNNLVPSKVFKNVLGVNQILHNKMAF
jgi:hypothetical protein